MREIAHGLQICVVSGLTSLIASEISVRFGDQLSVEFILIGHTGCLQDIDNLSASGSAGGYISGQIYYDAFSARFGHGGGGIVAMGITLVPHMHFSHITSFKLPAIPLCFPNGVCPP